MGRLEDELISFLQTITVVEFPTFPWLTNKFENLDTELRDVFDTLNGSHLGLSRKRTVRLRPDAFLPKFNCLFEFDEVQHFTIERKKSLQVYPANCVLGFNRDNYIELCDRSEQAAHQKGAAGYRKATAEFPFEGGRHAQRALFDAFRDLLPARHQLAPTKRFNEFDLHRIRKLDEKGKVSAMTNFLGPAA
jgi:hypothetical protein